jgi:peptide-N4-(N-acetyl-beta-glucosaminyl)asparagine amidase
MDDLDEQLARRLQLEEDEAVTRALLGRRHPGGAAAPTTAAAALEAERRRFAADLEAGLRRAAAHEDELARALALSVAPLDALSAAAGDAASLSVELGDDPPLAQEDALALELIRWFKADFFAWVDAPPCATCGAAGPEPRGAAPPTAAELAHGAARVETFACSLCSSVTRFPRYNDAAKLVADPAARRGRCGEWANAFGLLARAVGLDVRCVSDSTDHVWLEYYSAALQRWVHVDPCEGVADKPLLYDAGWGKQLVYCIAVGRDGAADVTRRYVADWEAALGRRPLDEAWVAGRVAAASTRLRAGLPAEERAALEAQDAADAAAMAAGGGGAAAPAEPLPGRQTGAAAWRAARGEGGAAPAEPAAAPPTRYARALDTGATAPRVAGGAVRASGDNPPSEVAAAATDGRPDTKWLCFGVSEAWLEYRLLGGAAPVAIARYALRAGGDAPERDPAHVALAAWREASERWEPLDERRGSELAFPARGARLEFAVAAAPPAARWRLRVRAVRGPGAANSVQLAEWALYSS